MQSFVHRQKFKKFKKFQEISETGRNLQKPFSEARKGHDKLLVTTRVRMTSTFQLGDRVGEKVDWLMLSLVEVNWLLMGLLRLADAEF